VQLTSSTQQLATNGLSGAPNKQTMMWSPQLYSCVLGLLVAGAAAAGNGCYDTCCFAPECIGGGVDCPSGTTLKLQSCATPCCVPASFRNVSLSCCKLAAAPTPPPAPTPPFSPTQVAKPTETQLAWQDFELGSLNSFQMVSVKTSLLRLDVNKCNCVYGCVCKVTFHSGAETHSPGQLGPNRPFDLAPVLIIA
jgi:hypothetical protein